MKAFIRSITAVFPPAKAFHLAMLFFRVLLSVELMIAHGLKKVGVGVAAAETVPNPLGLPDGLNQSMAIAANLVFPWFIMAGLFTRLAVLPVLGVTLTGYFILHWNDPIALKDVPFIYSLCYLLLLVLGPGKYSADYVINRELHKRGW